MVDKLGKLFPFEAKLSVNLKRLKRNTMIMRLLIITFCLLTAQGFAQSADDILGTWFNEEKSGKVKIVKQGEKYFGSIVWLEEPLEDAVFDTWLDTLIALKGPDLLRVKGIVFLTDLDKPFVFHGGQHIFEPPVKLKEWPKDDRRTRIVVIARNMSQPELQRSLDMLRAQPQQLEVAQ